MADHAQPCDIPIPPALRNKKFKVFAKGVLETGTAGVGFISADPSWAATNNGPCVWYSTAAYAGTTNIYGAAVAGTSFANSTSPFNAAAYGAESQLLRYRPVGAVLKVFCQSTYLATGGSIVGFSNPRHMGNAGRDFENIAGEHTSESVEVVKGKDKIEYRLFYKFVDSDDADYQTAFPTATAGTALSTDNAYHMTIMMRAPSAATSISFRWEFHVILNVIGRNVDGLTDGHADPVGFAAIQAGSAKNEIMAFTTEKPSRTLGKLIAASAGYAVTHQTTARKATLDDVAHGAHAVSEVAKGVADTVTAISVICDILDFF